MRTRVAGGLQLPTRSARDKPAAIDDDHLVGEMLHLSEQVTGEELGASLIGPRQHRFARDNMRACSAVMATLQ